MQCNTPDASSKKEGQCQKEKRKKEKEKKRKRKKGKEFTYQSTPTTLANIIRT
jgi:hypothetical protein